ncbi:gamma-glutamyltransferase [Variovorax sp. J22G21]|uniref:gamma-glutamyltransferase family protein n=1 Tax=Variovorax fucosicus TaxID=3053517 RepID=UPI0025786531|nr:MULTISPECIES: gamma-glutamyltransferase [unclassified Variovorax]MDM0041744.1 gamma-glutamyltransferase [Variovorax sp. J22R193]MDM0059583.1 gamma-glutamyltransferase [Variovorax sp. J22G21]
MTSAPQPTYRQAIGRRFAVSAGCPEAVDAALDVMQQGGNVVDAAVAAAAASCVAMPHMTGIGGELFALVCMKGRSPMAVNATGASPRGASIEAYRRLGHSFVPVAGGLSAQTPATPAGLEALVSHWGSRTLGELLRPAIKLSEEGFAIRPRLASYIAARQPELQSFEVWRRLYCPQGTPLQAGAAFRQTALAKTLRLIGEEGATAFANGWVGEDIAAAVQADGGFMTKQDILAVKAEVCEPLAFDYRGLTVLTQPPVSQGYIVLRALSLLAQRDPGPSDLWLAATDALRQAFGERLAYLRDEEGSHRKAMAMIHSKPMALQPFVPFTAHTGGDTTALAVMDAEGNAASVILSVFNDFGSGLVAPRSGVLLNNRLSAFFLDERYANALQPGRRSMHTLHSYIVRDAQGIRWAGGSPGADNQPQANLHVLLHLLHEGASPAHAVSARRWAVNPGTDPRDNTAPAKPPYIECEPGVPAEKRKALQDEGHELRTTEMPRIGSSKLVGRLVDGSLGAWADDRREGSVGAI